MTNIEFHTDPRTGEAMYKRIGDPIVRELTEKDADIIDYILSESEVFYPDQFAAVSAEYQKSTPNRLYYDFLRARRLINCCFGENDRQADIDEFGHYHFEHVKCPMIAECSGYKRICMPTFWSQLSERELSVMELYFNRVKTEDIASRLYLSIHTVNNHRKNALRKLHLRSIAEFIDYAHSNKLFSQKRL